MTTNIEASKQQSTPQTSTKSGLPLLGVRTFEPNADGGFSIGKLDRFGSCAKAGLVAGDVVVAVEGELLGTDSPAQRAEGLCQGVGPGGSVTIRFHRDGAAQELAVPLREKKKLNLDIKPLTEVLERKIAP